MSAVRLVHKKSSTFHDFPYRGPNRKCIHCWIVNVTPPGFSHCVHQCLYCYARDAIFSRSGSGTLEVYDNLPELVARDLDRISLCPPLSISNTTDPCQPVEELRREVRRLVRLLVERNLSLLLVTKGDATFLLDVPGFARHDRLVVATTIEGPPEVLGLLSPRAPGYEGRLASVRALADAGLRCVVRLDPVFPHLYQALYGASWREAIEGLVNAFAEAGCRHVICSTGRLSRKRPRGRPALSSFERMVKLVTGLDRSLGERFAGDYVFDRSGTSCGYLWRRPERVEFHVWLRERCEGLGMTYATCQESRAEETDSAGLPNCEGFALPFCEKGLDGEFRAVEGCTSLCQVSCRGAESPPCGRRALVSDEPLRISLLR